MPPAAAPPPPGGDTNPDDIARVPAVELRPDRPFPHRLPGHGRQPDPDPSQPRRARPTGRTRPVRPRPEGLDEFDCAHLICLLDRAWQADSRGKKPFTGERLRPVPFLLQHTGERVGVFATRAAARPNYLGRHLVRATAVRGNQVDFTGADLLDGTPVLDLKPFEPHLDVPDYQPGHARPDPRRLVSTHQRRRQRARPARPPRPGDRLSP
jgi:tRNA (Thr-GGU) A37 N-methylase